MAKYQLDRERFLKEYPVTIKDMTQYEKMLPDLIAGGEFIITAQDVLDKLTHVIGSLVGVQGFVLAHECELVYNLEKKNNYII